MDAEVVGFEGPVPAPSAVAGNPRASTLIASARHAAPLGFVRSRRPPGLVISSRDEPRFGLPGESRADSTLSSGVATGSVATSSVATRFVALSDVATSGVVGGRVTGGSVAAALVAAGGVAFEGVVVHGDAWVCSDGACPAGPRVCTGVPPAESAVERSDGTVVVAVAGGRVALVGSPAEFRPPIGRVAPVSTPMERLAGVDDGAFAAAAGVITGTSCWPGFAEPLAGGPLVALNNPPGVDLLPDDTSKADAPFDSGGEAIVAAGATYAWRRDADALAVAIQPKK